MVSFKDNIWSNNWSWYYELCSTLKYFSFSKIQNLNKQKKYPFNT